MQLLFRRLRRLILIFCVEQVGLYLSIIVGSVGVVAQVAGGAAADYMYARRNDLRWYAWVPAMTSSAATPFAIACYYVTSDATSLALFVIPTLAANCFDAPVRYMDFQSQCVRISRSHCTVHIVFCCGLNFGNDPEHCSLLADKCIADVDDCAESTRRGVLVLSLWVTCMRSNFVLC